MDHPPRLDLPNAQPATPNFQETIALATSALDAHAAGRLPLSELASLVTSWVSQVSGARGFLVTFLTGDWAIADDPPPEILGSIASAPTITVGLLVKNVAMAAAMTLTHTRQHHLDQVAQAQRTSDRAAQILLRLLHRTLDLPHTPQPAPTDPPFAALAIQDLRILQWHAAQTQRIPAIPPPHPDSDRHGVYHTFLDRWHYDSEQRAHIAAVLAHWLAQTEPIPTEQPPQNTPHPPSHPPGANAHLPSPQLPPAAP